MTYLIDGHNLIGAELIPGIHIDQEDDEARLVAWLRARQPNLRAPITVVFDGGAPGGTSLALSGGGVTAVFAARYRTQADSVIIRRVQNAPNPSHMTVVTGDRDLRRAVSHLGASVMQPADFVQRMNRPRRPPSVRRSSAKIEPKLPKSEVEAWLALFGVTDDEDHDQG
ncbi:MAG TPA: hypothetical protein EYP25_13495 [Anaerolineae bacterium]|nr:hypothetical protein [Anaerolineae bacterium]